MWLSFCTMTSVSNTTVVDNEEHPALRRIVAMSLYWMYIFRNSSRYYRALYVQNSRLYDGFRYLDLDKARAMEVCPLELETLRWQGAIPVVNPFFPELDLLVPPPKLGLELVCSGSRSVPWGDADLYSAIDEQLLVRHPAYVNYGHVRNDSDHAVRLENTTYIVPPYTTYDKYARFRVICIWMEEHTETRLVSPPEISVAWEHIHYPVRVVRRFRIMRDANGHFPYPTLTLVACYAASVFPDIVFLCALHTPTALIPPPIIRDGSPTAGRTRVYGVDRSS